MHMRVFAFSLLSAVAVAVVGCGGGNSTPSAPTAAPDITGTTANPFLFNGGAGVTIGTSGFQNITVQNTGSQTMLVNSVTYTGDAPITISGVAPATPANIAFDATFVVQLTCRPPAAGPYNGTVDIKSNASNLPDISIVFQCKGVAP